MSEVFDINLNGTVMVTKRFFDLLGANAVYKKQFHSYDDNNRQ